MRPDGRVRRIEHFATVGAQAQGRAISSHVAFGKKVGLASRWYCPVTAGARNRQKANVVALEYTFLADGQFHSLLPSIS